MMGNAEHVSIVQEWSCEMEPERAAAGAKARRYRNRGESCEVGGDCVDVLEVHLERVLDLADLKGCERGGRGSRSSGIFRTLF